MDPELELLVFRRGSSAPFTDWLDALKDVAARAVIRARLNRLRLGNFGDCKPVGSGVHEIRIDLGPGYRVYFGRRGSTLVMLLCGGHKGSQQRDIRKAQMFWKEFLNAQDAGER